MADIFKITDNNYYKIISYDALLPNLKYENKNIYFIPTNPIKIKLNDKIQYKSKFMLENISLTGKNYCIDTELNATIREKENNDGLIVNIKFRDSSNIYKKDMQKFARVVEAAILGINLMDDNVQEVNDIYNNYDYFNKNYDDVLNYDERLNYDTNDENNENDENDENDENYDNYENYENYENDKNYEDCD